MPDLAGKSLILQGARTIDPVHQYPKFPGLVEKREFQLIRNLPQGFTVLKVYTSLQGLQGSRSEVQARRNERYPESQSRLPAADGFAASCGTVEGCREETRHSSSCTRRQRRKSAVSTTFSGKYYQIREAQRR
jgi:hypothetical protein